MPCLRFGFLSHLTWSSFSLCSQVSIYEGDKRDCRKFCTTGIDGAMTIWDFKVCSEHFFSPLTLQQQYIHYSSCRSFQSSVMLFVYDRTLISKLGNPEFESWSREQNWAWSWGGSCFSFVDRSSQSLASLSSCICERGWIVFPYVRYSVLWCCMSSS